MTMKKLVQSLLCPFKTWKTIEGLIVPYVFLQLNYKLLTKLLMNDYAVTGIIFNLTLFD